MSVHVVIAGAWLNPLDRSMRTNRAWRPHLMITRTIGKLARRKGELHMRSNSGSAYLGERVPS